MAYRGYPLAVDLARVVTRYPLVMSDPSDLPPDSARQQTAATGFEIPVPTRGRFGANLDRICRGYHVAPRRRERAALFSARREAIQTNQREREDQ